MNQYEPRFGLRVFAVGHLLVLVVLAPVNVLWHGLPVLWQDYPQYVRHAWKTLATGKPGPYKGVAW